MILALGRQRPEEQELKASLDYRASQGQPELSARAKRTEEVEAEEKGEGEEGEEEMNS